MAFLEPSQTGLQVSPYAEGMLLEALPFDDVEYSQPGGARHRITAERVEVLHAAVKCLGDLARGHHGAERMAVPDGLPHGDDVGHDALGLEAPEVGPDPREAHLDLVRDAHGTGVARVSERRFQVSGRQLDLPAAAQQALADERRGSAGAVVGGGQGLGHVLGVAASALRILSAVGASVVVGHDHFVDVWRRPPSAGPVELVRADVHAGTRVAVVGPVHDHDVRPSGTGARQPQRQLVRLASRVHEVADLERLRQRRGQALRVSREPLVEVPRVRVQHGCLAPNRVDHMGVGVPHMADIVHAVEVGLALRVEQVLLPPAHDVEGLRVREAQGRSEDPPAGSRDPLGGRLSGRPRTLRQIQK